MTFHCYAANVLIIIVNLGFISTLYMWTISLSFYATIIVIFIRHIFCTICFYASVHLYALVWMYTKRFYTFTLQYNLMNIILWYS